MTKEQLRKILTDALIEERGSGGTEMIVNEGQYAIQLFDDCPMIDLNELTDLVWAKLPK